MTCHIHVTLDGAMTVRPGDLLEGTVSVETDDQVRCDGLTVATVFYTHGKGNRHVGVIEEQSLFAGEWSSGTHEYKFALRAPTDPEAYQGEVLSLTLAVRATADIPWAIDPESTVDFEVVQEPKVRGYEVSWSGKEAPDQWGFGAVILSGLGFVIAVGSAAVYQAAGGPFMVCAFVSGALALLGAVVGIPRWMAERRVGNIRFTLDQSAQVGYREAGAEGFLDASLTMSPDARPEAVRVTLTVQEVVVKGSGTNKTTYRHGIYEQALALKPSGEPGGYRGRIALPAPGVAPSSFKAPSNAIAWTVVPHVDIAGWPDWKEVVELTVKAV